ncbi:MAG TPA: nucleotide sugar dehydrogenase [Ktedonobacteraceae bacterium]|jgi:nucleotide sugar dehydrogenase
MDRSKAPVAVVGLGKIGLPLAVQYARHGRRVLGCDRDPGVVAAINAGRAHVQEEAELADVLPALVSQGHLSASTDTTEAVRQAGVVVVIVPVVVDGQMQVNFAAIDAATGAIGAGLRPGTLVIYETTLPIGSTAGRLAHLLEQHSHLVAGQDFLLAYSPERVSSGSLFYDLATYPKVVGGINQASCQAAVTFYRSVLEADVLTLASSSDAEFVKLIETTYRDVNIALANEFARFADVCGLDLMAAIAAANTQPYAHIHTPGVGVGGHCIPVYPYFLLAGLPADETGMLALPRLARRVNDGMAAYAVARLEQACGPLQGRAVLLLGVSYRADVRETACSSAWRLQEALVSRGALVYAHDPLFSDRELQTLGYRALVPGQEGQIVALILQAAHRAYQAFDFTRLPNCRVVLDGRQGFERQRIEALGLRYLALGDGGLSGQPEN